MNTYRIRYKEGVAGVRTVQADTVNGMKPTSDTYTFMREGEIVAAIPKSGVASVEKVNTESDD